MTTAIAPPLPVAPLRHGAAADAVADTAARADADTGAEPPGAIRLCLAPLGINWLRPRFPGPLY